MRTRRSFSDEFKVKIVEMVDSGAATQVELSRQYGISPVMIGLWKENTAPGKVFENKNNIDIASLKIRIS